MATNESVALLIIGSHRSGTSATTRVLNLLGVDLGGGLLPPAPDNEYGFWEHRVIFDLHERLLRDLDSSWHDVRPLPENWHKSAAANGYRQELASILRREFLGKPLWGFKDPRLCRLLPLWLDILTELRIEPRFVITVRNPLEIAHSLQTRDRFGLARSILLYLDNTLEALARTKGRPRAFVSYSALLDDWESVVKSVASKLRVEWPVAPASKREEIERFLRPSARHHVFSEQDLGRHPELLAWASELHAALTDASEGRTARIQRVTRAVRQKWLSASSLFVPEIDRLHDEKDALSSRLDKAAARIAELTKEHEGLRALKEASDRDAAELSGQLDRMSQELAAKRKDASLRDAVDELEGQCSSLEDRVTEERERNRRLQSGCADLGALGEKLREELQQSHLEQVRLQRKVERANEELQKVQTHLTSILSSRLYRWTRRPRQIWYRLKGEV